MILVDLECDACGQQMEELLSKGEKIRCPECSSVMKKVWNKGAPSILHTIVPYYPGAKKQKAGYTHTHGDRPATKIQSGYGGCVGPK